MLTADGAAVDLLSSDSGIEPLPARAAGWAAGHVRPQPVHQPGRHGDGLRLSRRHDPPAQRPHDGAPGQPGGRLRVPGARGRRPVRRRLVAAVAGRAGDQGMRGAARDGRPARRVRDVRRAHPRPGLRRRPAGRAQVSTARRWGRPRGLFYEVTANTSDAALAQDGKGRLHAAIVGYSDSGERSCIAYARSSRKRWFTRAVSSTRRSRTPRSPAASGWPSTTRGAASSTGRPPAPPPRRGCSG